MSTAPTLDRAFENGLLLAQQMANERVRKALDEGKQELANAMAEFSTALLVERQLSENKRAYATTLGPHPFVWTGRSPDTCAVVSPDGSSQWCGLSASHPIHQVPEDA